MQRIFSDCGTTRRELWLTAAGLAAALLAIADILTVLAECVAARRWGAALGQALFLVIVAYFVYGACVYLLESARRRSRRWAVTPQYGRATGPRP